MYKTFTKTSTGKEVTSLRNIYIYTLESWYMLVLFITVWSVFSGKGLFEKDVTAFIHKLCDTYLLHKFEKAYPVSKIFLTE